MLLTVVKIALVTFLIVGCVTLIVVYLVRRRRVPGWSPPTASMYGALGGEVPRVPPPDWVHWPDDEPDQPDDPGPASRGRPG